MRDLKTFLASFMMATAVATSTAQDIEFTPLNIFTDAPTIYPTVVDSTLYFSSNHKWNLGKTYLNQNDQHLYQIYSVDIRDEKPDGRAKPYLQGNAREYNMYSITFDAEERAYISQNNMEASTLRGNPVALYVYDSNDENTKGRRVEQLPAKANCGMAVISEDGKTMIFSSDMKGGVGRADLYYCEKSGGAWSEPVNMGQNINTPGNETSPYFHPSGKIFFASDGREDSQNLDIYYTYKTADGFADPKRFDSGINSSKDDYGFFYSADETWGYITSNRDGRDQIYHFRRSSPGFTEVDSMEIMDLCYTFYEASAENYDTTTFSCQWKFSDGITTSGVEVDHCFSGPGLYTIELSVLDKTSGEEMFSLAEYELEIVRPIQVDIALPEVIKVGEPVSFSASTESLEGFVAGDYYWDMGNGDKLKGQEVTTVFAEAGTYRVQCGVICGARRCNERHASFTWITVE